MVLAGSSLFAQIEDGEVHASLDQQGGMVSFAENPENYDSLMTVQHIHTQLQSCIALEQKLGALDREMALDPRYVHRVGTVSFRNVPLQLLTVV